MMADTIESLTAQFGVNAAYIADLYERYLQDAGSVSEDWREFFAGLRSSRNERPDTAGATGHTGVVPIRGIGARVVANMETSLGVPTATSSRTIPVKILEENRTLINRHREIVESERLSYTHIVAWALVKALASFPA